MRGFKCMLGTVLSPSSRAAKCCLFRSIQTAATVHHPSLDTALLSAIREATAPHHGFTSIDMPSHALVLVSRHYFPSEKADIGQLLHSTITKTIGDRTVQVAGGIVDEIPERKNLGIPGVSILLASEDEGASIHTFEDEVDHSVSVGRAWKLQGSSAEQQVKSDTWIPSGDLKSLFGGKGQRPPQQQVEPRAWAREAIILTKGEFSSFDWPAEMFPSAALYGLVPSSTPFLTGLPMTLCHNQRIISTGGLAMAFPRRRSIAQVDHPHLRMLGRPILVTKSQGNILILLDNQAATYTLLECIRTVLHKDLKLSKDILLFGQIHHKDTKIADAVSRPMIKIIAGDPGKGSMALNGGYRVQEGDSIQLFYEQISDQDHLEPIQADVPTVKLVKVPADSGDEYESGRPVAVSQAEKVSEFTFTGGSCAGLVLGSAGKPGRTYVSEPVHSSILLR